MNASRSILAVLIAATSVVASAQPTAPASEPRPTRARPRLHGHRGRGARRLGGAGEGRPHRGCGSARAGCGASRHPDCGASRHHADARPHQGPRPPLLPPSLQRNELERPGPEGASGTAHGPGGESREGDARRGLHDERDLGTEGAGYADAGIKQAVGERASSPGPRLLITSRAINRQREAMGRRATRPRRVCRKGPRRPADGVEGLNYSRAIRSAMAPTGSRCTPTIAGV